jgi:Amt family ammonium transporter
VGAIAGFVAICMTIIFGGIKLVMGLRVTEEEEVEGLDVHEHGSPGYGQDISIASPSTSVPVGTNVPAGV